MTLAARALVAQTDPVPTIPIDDPVAKSRIVRGAWFGIGWVSVAFGGVGVIVPGLPTTIFMILAAACFARCSPRFEQWILDLPGIGRSVSDYRSGLGMPLRAKVAAISMLMIAVSISAGLILSNTAVRVVVIVVGLIGVWFIALNVPTRRAVVPSLPGGPA